VAAGSDQTVTEDTVLNILPSALLQHLWEQALAECRLMIVGPSSDSVQ
jgi:hypothetical protein